MQPVLSDRHDDQNGSEVNPEFYPEFYLGCLTRDRSGQRCKLATVVVSSGHFRMCVALRTVRCVSRERGDFCIGTPFHVPAHT